MTELEKRKYQLLGKELVYNARIDVVESLRGSGFSDMVISLIMNQPESVIRVLDYNHYVNEFGNANAQRPSKYATYSSPKKTEKKYSYEDVIFETHSDAAKELKYMEDLLDEYDFVSVADFWDLMGLPANYSDDKIGWKDLSGVDIKMCGGGWKLILPEPKEERDEN